ncbi:MAG: tetratricopeptide repeat protein, partial [Candidatus Cloacimonadaceae bacterium]|nr:tetratricopeptide repeat protein [Candidatus Cloacimonadaceae bacterium]
KEYIKWMKLSAENGNTRAQSSLGDEYLNGGYVEQDHTEAVKWLKLAANKGDEDAQRNLGDCYMYGYGVPQSHVEAFKLYAPLAEKGNHTLALNMGNAYEFGDGVKQDYEQAYKWYLLAANNSQDDYMAYNYNITLVQKMKAKLSASQKAKIDAEVARLQESIDLLNKEDSNDLLYEDDY